MATDALVVASFLVPESKPEIWGKSARLLLASMIGYTLASPLYADAQHLRSVSRLTTTGEDFQLVLRTLVKTEGEHLPTWVIDGFNQFIALEKETRNSALFNVTTALNPWNSGLIAAATETSDFDIRTFRKTKTALFIGCSIAQLDVYRPLIKILVQQIHDLLMTNLPDKAKEPYQVLMMIDEFRQLGKMDDLVSKLTINAGYGFRMVLILQDLGQLDEVYGKATRITTVSACQVKLFIRINDLETSDYVSDMLGTRTLEIASPTIRPGQGWFGGVQKSIRYEGAPLRTAAELREMPEDRAILIIPNSPGFELRKIAHWRDRPYKVIHDANLFKVHPLPELKSSAEARPDFVNPEPTAEAVVAEVGAKTQEDAKVQDVEAVGERVGSKSTEATVKVAVEQVPTGLAKAEPAAIADSSHTKNDQQAPTDAISNDTQTSAEIVELVKPEGPEPVLIEHAIATAAENARREFEALAATVEGEPKMALLARRVQGYGDDELDGA